MTRCRPTPKPVQSAREAVQDGLADFIEIRQARRRIDEAARDRGLSVAEYFWRHRCRQHAKSIGLAYWPALMWRPKGKDRSVDPAAFVAAERILTRETGCRWGDPREMGTAKYRLRWPGKTGRSRGGWDWAEHWGISPRSVARMWLAAGCRDSDKFRLMVTAAARLPTQYSGSPIASRRMSARQTADYIRGWRWLHSGRTRSGNYKLLRRLELFQWTKNAIVALGRLSPLMRGIAVSGVSASPVRIRDLDWAAVGAAQKQLNAVPASARPRIRAALAGTWRRAARELGLEHLGNDVISAMLRRDPPPRISYKTAADIVLGRDPSGGQLTKQECHEWLLAGTPDVPRWLAERLGVPPHRSVRVIRWMAAVRARKQWAAIERPRVHAVDGQGLRHWRAIDVLDEIQGEDIVVMRDGVDRVMTRVAVRCGTAWLTAAMRDMRPLAPIPPWARYLRPWMRLLRTPADLAREGIELDHCVGGYAGAVGNGECHIVAISTRNGRSTLELGVDCSVLQHLAISNNPPPPRHLRLVAAWRKRLRS